MDKENNMDSLKNIVLDGENINLDNLSLEELRDLLNKINNREIVLKEEIDDMAKRLA